MAELSRLDDHLLADIGIDRAQIPMIAQGLIAPSNAVPRRTVRAAPGPTQYRGGAANDSGHAVRRRLTRRHRQRFGMGRRLCGQSSLPRPEPSGPPAEFQ